MHVYDKDLCRVWAFRYRKEIIKDGIKAGYYTPDDNLLETVDKNADNSCFCEDNTNCTIKGLQYIGPCQFSEYIKIKSYNANTLVPCGSLCLLYCSSNVIKAVLK